jgi:transcriptional antiterminator RfaH
VSTDVQIYGPSEESCEKGSFAWFCLRSQPKHEHIAVAHLRRDPAIEAFAPRVRFRRLSRLGAVWATEALFPSYFFARLDPAESLRRVHFCPGVRGIVHFGNRWPVIPVDVIEELRSVCGADEIRTIEQDLQEGEEVRIAGGALHGLTAVVKQVMPGSQRIAVLMEFLGRQTLVEVCAERLVRI